MDKSNCANSRIIGQTAVVGTETERMTNVHIYFFFHHSFFLQWLVARTYVSLCTCRVCIFVDGVDGVSQELWMGSKDPEIRINLLKTISYINVNRVCEYTRIACCIRVPHSLGWSRIGRRKNLCHLDFQSSIYCIVPHLLHKIIQSRAFVCYVTIFPIEKEKATRNVPADVTHSQKLVFIARARATLSLYNMQTLLHNATHG